MKTEKEWDEEKSETGDDSSPPDSRKKATHLRCERQRREAINQGYADLKNLLPSAMSPLGCKTTNASILYRACDYIRQLQSVQQKTREETNRLKHQITALQMICSQYEQMAIDHQEQSTSQAGSASPLNAKFDMFHTLMDEWFNSFESQVNTDSYAQLTRSLLVWLETGLDFDNASNLLDQSKQELS